MMTITKTMKNVVEDLFLLSVDIAAANNVCYFKVEEQVISNK
jgi:hypothetical protein